MLLGAPCARRSRLQRRNASSRHTAKKDEDAELVAERISLLKERWQLRHGLTPGADVEMIRLRLVLVARRLRRLRARQQKEREQCLLGQLWEACRLRDFSRVHKLRSYFARSGFAPLRRHYWAPSQLIPSKQQWEEAASQPGMQGGLDGQITSLAEHVAQYSRDVAYIEIAPLVGDKNIDG